MGEEFLFVARGTWHHIYAYIDRSIYDIPYTAIHVITAGTVGAPNLTSSSSRIAHLIFN